MNLRNIFVQLAMVPRSEINDFALRVFARSLITWIDRLNLPAIDTNDQQSVERESDRWLARAQDDANCHDAHERIAFIVDPFAKSRAAMRASRSFSAPDTCIRHDECTRDGQWIVWPDGEKWPTRLDTDR